MYESPIPTQPLQTALTKYLNFKCAVSLRRERKSDDWELDESSVNAINVNIHVNGYKEVIESIGMFREDDTSSGIDVVLTDTCVFKYSYTLADGKLSIERALAAAQLPLF